MATTSNVEEEEYDAGPTNLDCILPNLWLGMLKV